MSKVIKNKKIISILITFCMFILVIGSNNIGSDSITQVGERAMKHQGILFCWNINGSQFSIANENGLGSPANNEGQFFKTATFPNLEPFQNFSLNSGVPELLDINWCPWDGHYSNFVALATGCAGTGPPMGVMAIRNTSDWSLNASLDNNGKSHVVEWHPNQKFLISEHLNCGTVSYLIIWNCSSPYPDQWQEVRILRDGAQADMFNMFVNGNRDLLSWEKNDGGYTNYKVHVWNISDTNCSNWTDIPNSPLLSREVGAFSPNGHFIVTVNKPGQNTNYIYYTSNLSLYKTINNGIGDPRFSPDTIDTAGELVSGYMAGYKLSDVNNIVVYNISNNWATIDIPTTMPSACRVNFNQNGTLLGVASGVDNNVFRIYNWDFGIQENIDAPQFIDINNGVNATTIVDSTPTFNWTLTANTSKYKLQISNNSAFTDIVQSIDNICVEVYPTEYIETTNVSFTLPEVNKLTKYKTYYCRVRSYTK